MVFIVGLYSFSIWSLPRKVSIKKKTFTGILSWKREETLEDHFVSSENTIFILWISTPISPQNYMSSLIKTCEKRSELTLCSHILWSSLVIPWSELECRNFFSEFLFEISRNPIFVDTISSFSSLTSSIKSYKFYIRISPDIRTTIIGGTILWELSYDGVFTSGISKREEYSTH